MQDFVHQLWRIKNHLEPSFGGILGTTGSGAAVRQCGSGDSARGWDWDFSSLAILRAVGVLQFTSSVLRLGHWSRSKFVRHFVGPLGRLPGELPPSPRRRKTSMFSTCLSLPCCLGCGVCVCVCCAPVLIWCFHVRVLCSLPRACAVLQLAAVRQRRG